MQIASACAQIQNRVNDQLPGPMVGRLASPVGFKPWIREPVHDVQAGLVWKPPNGVDRLMFQENDTFFTMVQATLEPFFLENATRWADALRDAGAEVVIEQRAGNHGDPFWADEFPLMVAWAFGHRNSRSNEARDA